jgi:hypothetical protein
MTNLFTTLPLVACLLMLCISSLGATEYVIANHDSAIHNYLSIYTLDLSAGTLKQVSLLDTNGTGLGPKGGGAINFANIEQALSSGGACIFGLNANSSDIAAFSAATKYSLVGNYSNSALNASENGGSLALTPNGKFLYASYSYTGNIGAWQVNPDCSLTFIASYVPLGGTAVGAIKVSPNGQALVVPFYSTIEEPGVAEMFRINSSSGSLTDVGYLANPCNLTVTCGFYGLDFTKDSKFVVISALVHGNVGDNAYALTAEITTNGLVKPRNWPLPNSVGIQKPISPFFSAAGYAGSGNLYFGSSSGVIVVDFVENPLKLTVTNAQSVGGGAGDGNIAVTGNIMVMGVPEDEIDVFSIAPDGSLTTLSTTTVTGGHLDVFSLILFPETR